MTDIGELSRSLEDYLEIVFNLIREKKVARIRDIAKKKKVKMASAVSAMKRLGELGMVEYEAGEFIRISEKGEQLARKIHERHQLLKRFLTGILFVSEGNADRDACAMEHNTSRETIERIVGFMEFLESCPFPSELLLERFKHCYPPAGSDKKITMDDCREPDCEALMLKAFREYTEKEKTVKAKKRKLSISDLEPGQKAKILQIRASSVIRQRLIDMGVLPDVEVEVVRRAPLGDPIELKIKGYYLSLRKIEASSIRVVLLD